MLFVHQCFIKEFGGEEKEIGRVCFFSLPFIMSLWAMKNDDGKQC